MSFPSSPIPCSPLPSAALLLPASVSPPVISLSLARSLTIEKSPADYRFPLPVHSVFNEIFFLFCYPHTLTIRLKRPVYRGFSGEGKCEGKLSPLTLALTPSHQNPSKIPLSCQGTNILPLIEQVPHTCKIRQIRSISVRKKTFAYVKLNTNLPQTNHLICRQNQ